VTEADPPGQPLEGHPDAGTLDDPLTPDASTLDALVAPVDDAPDHAGPRWRRLVRRAYGVALVAAAVTVVVLRRDEVGDLLSGARLLPLVGALALGLVSLWQSALFWSRGLAGLGERRTVGAVLEATVAAIPARYLPGSIWYAAGRVGHLRRSGTPAVALTVVAAVETLLSFVVAVALGAGLLIAAGSGDSGVGVGALLAVAAGLALAASPWVVNPALRWIAARRGIGTVPEMRWGAYAELCGHLVAFWAASAAAFLCYLAAFPAIDAPGAARTAGTFLVAWAAGFIAVFAPQGAGVFETTLAGLLTGAPVAALALVLGGYRAVTAVRDALALLALAATRTRARR
jgi:hypothetical protein